MDGWGSRMIFFVFFFLSKITYNITGMLKKVPLKRECNKRLKYWSSHPRPLGGGVFFVMQQYIPAHLLLNANENMWFERVVTDLDEWVVSWHFVEESLLKELYAS